MFAYMQHEELEKRKLEELKLKIAMQQSKSCSNKCRKLLTYENDNFKHRVVKIFQAKPLVVFCYHWYHQL
jgi:predicted nucleic acid-binding Zn ribbon protein